MKTLSAAIEANAIFKLSRTNIGIVIPRSNTGSILGKSPSNLESINHFTNMKLIELIEVLKSPSKLKQLYLNESIDIDSEPIGIYLKDSLSIESEVKFLNMENILKNTIEQDGIKYVEFFLIEDAIESVNEMVLSKEYRNDVEIANRLIQYKINDA